MPRYLGIDHGLKRIGLAVSDAGGTLASPLATIDVSGMVTDQIAIVIERSRECDVDAFVVGLPLNMDGSEGRQAKFARQFGDEIGRITGKPVHYWDERLSTFAAQELLRPADLTRKKRKARMDRVAAQVILQSFLDTPGS